jgi:ornithine cyclodeaminase
VPRPDGFVAAVGSFAPDMAEIAAPVCRAVAASGRIVLDTPEAAGEAGDLLQAGIEVKGLSTLRGIVQGGAMARSGPVLFKNCGWAGWDLAAARLALSLAQ